MAKKRDRTKAGVAERLCNDCGQWLALEDNYSKDPGKSKGRKHSCRKCLSIKRAGGNPKIESHNHYCPNGHNWWIPGNGYIHQGELACLICRNRKLEMRLHGIALGKARRKTPA